MGWGNSSAVCRLRSAVCWLDMELLVIFVIIFVIYGAGWIWQTVNDILRDIGTTNWESRVYGQVASPRAIGRQDFSNLRQAFQRFAERFDGQLHDRPLFESPKVSFVHQGSRVLLSIYEGGLPPPELHTQLTYTVPQGWTWRLEVFPQRSKGTEMNPVPRNVDDLQVGDEAFDPRFVVKSNDPAFAREFLDAPLRKVIEDIRGLRGNDQVLVSLNSSRLMVRILGLPAGLADLAAFAELSGKVYDRIQLLWQKSTGIEILDEEALPSDAADPVCQVCGSAVLPENRVYCRRCRTPHHRDCWEFNGQCSTYACGEKRNTTKY